MEDPLRYLLDPANVPQEQIEIAIDPTCTPRQQIDDALAKLPQRVCRKHRYEGLQLNCEHTLRELVTRHNFGLEVDYGRCTRCPFDYPDLIPEFRRLRLGVPVEQAVFCATNANRISDIVGAPEPNWAAVKTPSLSTFENSNIDLDLTVAQLQTRLVQGLKARHCQFAERLDEAVRPKGDSEPLLVKAVRLRPNFDRYLFTAFYHFCGACALEALGATPEEARCRFGNFTIDPSEIQKHLETCRVYASQPKGILLLSGLVGNGKTHLSIPILLAALRRGESGRFYKFRRLVEQHREAKRPVAFSDTPPVSPLRACQQTDLLVLDDLREAKDNRDIEDLLLDLLDARIGRHRPTVITTNIARTELEDTLGSRVFDRLRGACYAVVEFNFPSKRGPLNGDYLKRD